MGVPIADELIDYEIRPLISVINNFDFAQTIACCSGWTGEEGISDGSVNRVWIGGAYVSIRSLNDAEIIKFFKYLSERLVLEFWYRLGDADVDRYFNYLSRVEFLNDNQQLFHIDLEYRNKQLLFTIHIYEEGRTTESIQKILDLILIVTQEYALLLA